MKRRKFIKGCVAILLILGILFFAYKSYPHFYIAITYEKAEKLIAQERFSEAYELLGSYYFEIDDYYLTHYKDTQMLLCLCSSHLAYEQGDLEGAYEQFNILDLKMLMKYQTEEQTEAIAAYCAKVKAEYGPFAEAKAKEEAAKEYEKLQSNVPYVGMSEVFIDQTILGAPSPKTRSNSEMINGERHFSTIYDFLENGKVIFTARCIQGEVTDVWDKRTDSTSQKNGSYSFSKETDPYNASSYRTAEAFYDANYDNFFCFEDAESYYYEHRSD